MKEMRAEKDEANRTRRIASNMAKMVREFWGNIEKVSSIASIFCKY